MLCPVVSSDSWLFWMPRTIVLSPANVDRIFPHSFPCLEILMIPSVISSYVRIEHGDLAPQSDGRSRHGLRASVGIVRHRA